MSIPREEDSGLVHWTLIAKVKEVKKAVSFREKEGSSDVVSVLGTIEKSSSDVKLKTITVVNLKAVSLQTATR